MEELDPKYQKKVDGSYYRLPTEGKINDGIKIDRGADKWDLSRETDGGIRVEGKTIRLKIWADRFMEQEDLMEEVEKHNPDWSYEIARNLGYWLNDKDWKNIEITSIIKFRKSPRSDPFVGYVVRSGIHDTREDKEIADRPNACHAGSSYHSNLDGKGGTEEKIEFLHADYGNAHKIIRTISHDGTELSEDKRKKDLPKFGNIHNKKLGFKFCLYNFTGNGKKFVKSETYFDLENDGRGPYIKGWETTYDGKEVNENKKIGGEDNSPLMEWGGPYVILKSNDSKYMLYDLEIKEIVPPI